MSEENVTIACEFIEAIGDGRYDEAVTYLHPNAEWHNTRAFPGAGTVTGHDAIREFWRDLFGAYGADRGGAGVEVERTVDAGEVVVVLVHGWGRGRDSDIPVDTRWAHLLRIQNAEVVRIDIYGTFDRAIEAAGLSG
jgi:ketosteroid isomerase-like protein